MNSKIIKDTIFEFAYQEALNDATQRLAYKGEKNKITANTDVKNVVKNYVDGILLGKNPDMLETARKVASYINDTEFSFGNIQKMINMTIKYIFISSYACEELREKFSSCHCPMDSIMLGKVRKAYLEYNGNDKKDSLLFIPLGNGKHSIDISKTAWSKISFEVYEGVYSRSIYDNYQEMVKKLAEKEGLIPIEYDFLVWNNEI